MSGVLRMLSGGASPAEAVSRLALADMAGRLRPAASEATSPPAPTGDLTLF